MRRRDFLGAVVGASSWPIGASAQPSGIPTIGYLSSLSETQVAACGGNPRDAVKALIVANEYLESEICDLMQAVSHAYVRGSFKTYTG